MKVGCVVWRRVSQVGEALRESQEPDGTDVGMSQGELGVWVRWRWGSWRAEAETLSGGDKDSGIPVTCTDVCSGMGE